MSHSQNQFQKLALIAATNQTAKIAILQLTSPGSSLMYSKKSVGPRMKFSGTSMLVRYSCEE